MTRCAECHSSLAAGQRFCLECGTRAGAPLPAALGLAPLSTDAAAAVAPPAPRPPFMLPSPPVAAVTVMVMLGFGVFLATEAGPRTDVSLAAARSPIVLEMPPAAATGAPSTPATAPDPDPGAGASVAAPDVSAPAPAVPAPAVPVAAATAPAPTGGGGGGGGSGTTPEPPASTEPPALAPPIEHVWVLRLAEHADQLPSLADYRLQGGWLSGWKPIGDGGLADVVALLSGQQACLDPAAPCAFGPDVVTVLDQLAANQKTWRGYVEDLPATPASCQQQPPTPGDPFGAFASLAAAKECVPLAQLATDLTGKPAPDAAPPPGASARAAAPQATAPRAAKPKLPNLSLVLPGLAKVDPAVADPWLTQTIQQITATKDYQQGGLIVVELADGVLLLSKYVAPETETKTSYDAFALLHTLQDVFNLQTLDRSAEAPAFDDTVWTAWSQDVHE